MISTATMCETLMMRRGLVLAVFVVLPVAGAFVACGLDEGGTASDASVDVTKDGAADVISDVIADVPIDVPQACATLDATACVDAALPSGWTYAAVADGDLTCPSNDYAKNSYFAQPKPDAGCLCGCAASGTLNCSGSINAGTQANCNGGNSFVFDAGNDAACIDTSWNDKHIAIGPLPAVKTTNAQCDASAPPPGWTASAATACTPNCAADYCAATGAFQRCIVSTTSQACPAPFTKQAASLGTAQQITTSCTGCTCAIKDTPCAATIVAYQNTGCSQAIAGAIPTDGSCPPQLPSNINSFSYQPSVPQPQCAVTAGGTASAGFTQSITVCCLP
jgi:hypothetical protein